MKVEIKKVIFFLVIILLFTSLVTAKASIVNINSRTNHEGNPVSVLLSAGTYDVTPIGTADGGAYNYWNAWNWGQVYGCDGNGANCTVGWINTYYLYSSEFGEIALTDNVRYANSTLALSNAIGTSFTLTSDTTVDFYIRDGSNGSLAWDNTGGMSLNVSVVPEPISSTLFIIGGATLGFRRFRKSK